MTHYTSVFCLLHPAIDSAPAKGPAASVIPPVVAQVPDGTLVEAVNRIEADCWAG